MPKSTSGPQRSMPITTSYRSWMCARSTRKIRSSFSSLRRSWGRKRTKQLFSVKQNEKQTTSLENFDEMAGLLCAFTATSHSQSVSGSSKSSAVGKHRSCSQQMLHPVVWTFPTSALL